MISLLLFVLVIVSTIAVLVMARRRSCVLAESYQDQPHAVTLTYRSWSDCAQCPSFKPVYDAFVAKNDKFLARNGVSTGGGFSDSPKPLKLGKPGYPDISFVNSALDKLTLHFAGPYTDEGLDAFLDLFKSRYPNRAKRFAQNFSD